MPNADELKFIYDNATSHGSGLAAVCSKIQKGVAQIPQYGPVRKLSNMAKGKFRTLLRSRILMVTSDKDAG